jgi:hypothetical protein
MYSRYIAQQKRERTRKREKKRKREIRERQGGE